MASVQSSRFSGPLEYRLEPAFRLDSRLQPAFGVPASAGVVRRHSRVRYSPCSSSRFSGAFVVEGHIAAAPVRSTGFSRAFVRNIVAPRINSLGLYGCYCRSSRRDSMSLAPAFKPGIRQPKKLRLFFCCRSSRRDSMSLAPAFKPGIRQPKKLRLFFCCRSSRRDRMIVAQHFSAGDQEAQEVTFFFVVIQSRRDDGNARYRIIATWTPGARETCRRQTVLQRPLAKRKQPGKGAGKYQDKNLPFGRLGVATA